MGLGAWQARVSGVGVRTLVKKSDQRFVGGLRTVAWLKPFMPAPSVQPARAA